MRNGSLDCLMRLATLVSWVVALLPLFMPARSIAAASPSDKSSLQMRGIYTTGGEDALREYVRKHRRSVSARLMLEMAETAVKERDDIALAVARTVVEELDDDAAIAEVNYRWGDYCYLVSDFPKAELYLQSALSSYKQHDDSIGIGNVSRRLADIYSRTRRRDEAAALLADARAQFAEASYERGLGNVCLSQWYLDFMGGDAAKGEQDLVEAQGHFERAKDPGGLGAVYRNKAYAAYMTGDSPNAIASYEKALPLFRDAGDYLGHGNVLRGAGDAYSDMGENEKALQMYQQALPFHEKAKDPRGQGYILLSQSDVYDRRGDVERARTLCGESLGFFERAGDLVGQGIVYQHLGMLSWRTGDRTLATEMYGKAEPFFKATGDLWGQGNVLADLAAIQAERMAMVEALRLYQQALPFFLKADDPRGLGNVYFGIGDVCFSVGDYEKSRDMFDKADQYFVKAGLLPDHGNVLLRKGDIHVIKGEYEKALRLFDEALPLYEKLEDDHARGLIYLRKASVLRKTGNNLGASEACEKAAPLFVKAQYLVGLGNLNQVQAEVALDLGDLDKADAFADKAVELFVKTDESGFHAATLLLKARAMARRGRPDEAMHIYLEALELREKQRGLIGLPEMKSGFMERSGEDYVEAAQFALDHGFAPDAFQIVEGIKSRAFLDLLAESLVDLEKGISPDLRSRRDALQDRLSSLRRQKLQENQKESPSESQVAAINAETVKVESDLGDLRTQIRLQNPMYASVSYPETATSARLQEVLRPDEVLVEYFVSSNATYCFITAQGSFDVMKLKLASSEIERLTKSWLLAISSPAVQPEMTHGRALYQGLLGPLQQRILGKKLIIVPDGILSKLPFETLPVRGITRPEYLLQKCAVKYAQSASVLHLLRTQYKREGTTDWFVGFGDPVYDYESFKSGKPEQGVAGVRSGEDAAGAPPAVAGYARAGGKLTRLEGSGEEVQGIAALFAENKIEHKANLRLEACEELAKAGDITKYGYIHFAAHGVAGDRFQAIALSQVPDAQDDGFLTLGEIMNCRYNARLVTLSACQSGLEQAEGQGVTGLTRAVMYAGSPAAMVSLWDVSDVGTHELMTRFYAHLLKDSMTKEDALRSAKTDLLRLTGFRHPYFWGAFVMYGE
ncbi:MAG: CHAT domain-containing protein [Acidobacteriota bacterium]